MGAEADSAAPLPAPVSEADLDWISYTFDLTPGERSQLELAQAAAGPAGAQGDPAARAEPRKTKAAAGDAELPHDSTKTPLPSEGLPATNALRFDGSNDEGETLMFLNATELPLQLEPGLGDQQLLHTGALPSTREHLQSYAHLAHQQHQQLMAEQLHGNRQLAYPGHPASGPAAMLPHQFPGAGFPQQSPHLQQLPLAGSKLGDRELIFDLRGRNQPGGFSAGAWKAAEAVHKDHQDELVGAVHPSDTLGSKGFYLGSPPGGGGVLAAERADSLEPQRKRRAISTSSRNSDTSVDSQPHPHLMPLSAQPQRQPQQHLHQHQQDQFQQHQQQQHEQQQQQEEQHHHHHQQQQQQQQQGEKGRWKNEEVVLLLHITGHFVNEELKTIGEVARFCGVNRHGRAIDKQLKRVLHYHRWINRDLEDIKRQIHSILASDTYGHLNPEQVRLLDLARQRWSNQRLKSS